MTSERKVVSILVLVLGRCCCVIDRRTISAGSDERQKDVVLDLIGEGCTDALDVGPLFESSQLVLFIPSRLTCENERVVGGQPQRDH